MKYLKAYESVNENVPQVGDYVICHEKTPYNDQINPFLYVNIGEITEDRGLEYTYPYKIDFDNNKYPFAFLDLHYFGRDEVIFSSPNKEDLEPIINRRLATKKYRLG